MRQRVGNRPVGRARNCRVIRSISLHSKSLQNVIQKHSVAVYKVYRKDTNDK
ncbi:hypothetical protein CKA32_004510 [Geitlerinema sp. FC II]|nr:hypothetical protein CKA32_004510 [Geitlerinema sp. FC II]